jgi:hypothetical protein
VLEIGCWIGLNCGLNTLISTFLHATFHILAEPFQVA